MSLVTYNFQLIQVRLNVVRSICLSLLLLHHLFLRSCKAYTALALEKEVRWS
jgi:hypothetical protein